MWTQWCAGGRQTVFLLVQVLVLKFTCCGNILFRSVICILFFKFGGNMVFLINYLIKSSNFHLRVTPQLHCQLRWHDLNPRFTKFLPALIKKAVNLQIHCCWLLFQYSLVVEYRDNIGNQLPIKWNTHYAFQTPNPNI